MLKVRPSRPFGLISWLPADFSFHDANPATTVDALCRLWTCSESFGPHPLIFWNRAWRQYPFLWTSRRHFSPLVSSRIDRPENDGGHVKEGFLEDGSFRLPSLDEIYDLRLLHLCVREFCALHYSRFYASAAEGRWGASAGSLARLLRPLDGFLFGGSGGSDHGLSPRPFESAASMSVRPRNRLERQLLSDMRIGGRFPPRSKLTANLSCHVLRKRGIQYGARPI